MGRYSKLAGLCIVFATLGMVRDLSAIEGVSGQAVAVPAAAPVPPPWLTVEINIPAKELSLVAQDKVIAKYPVAIGQLAHRSVTMESEIRTIEWNPWWYPPPSPWAKNDKITPPGPKNPLGPVKFPLDQGIRIHGTNNEKSVGRAASHGCFRMRNDDAVELGWYLQSHFSDQTDPTLLEKYSKNRRQTYHVTLLQTVPVKVIYEPAVVREDTLHLYPDVYGRVHDWLEKIQLALQNHGMSAPQLPKERVEALKKMLKQDQLTVPVHELIQPEVNTPPAPVS